MEVYDLILVPPAETPYETLKEQLIRLPLSSNDCKQLLTTEELEDRKPSQLISVATGATGFQPSRLFYVSIRSLGLCFFVNTGAV